MNDYNVNDDDDDNVNDDNDDNVNDDDDDDDNIDNIALTTSTVAKTNGSSKTTTLHQLGQNVNAQLFLE